MELDNRKKIHEKLERKRLNYNIVNLENLRESTENYRKQ